MSRQSWWMVIVTHESYDSVLVGTEKQKGLESLSEHREWRRRCDVERKVVPDGSTRNQKRPPADCRETNEQNVQTMWGRRPQPSSGCHVGNACQWSQHLKCQTVALCVMRSWFGKWFSRILNSRGKVLEVFCLHHVLQATEMGQWLTGAHCRWPSRFHQWWECKFLGEGIIDQGGGFRDSLSDLAEELCPSSSDCPMPLPFFIRTPNQVTLHCSVQFRAF